MSEIWKDIKWTNGFYEVSDYGNVRAKRRIYMRRNGRQYTALPRSINPHYNDGYLRVRLNVPGYSKWHSIHKLVIEAFVGARPKNYVIAHNDGNKTNNTLSNLRYATNEENQKDRKLHNTWHDKTERALTETQVIEIRNRRAAGEQLASLSEEFAVTKSYITMICTGKVAKHIAGPIITPRLPGRARKLTNEQVAEIVKRRSDGETIVSLGKNFKVHHSLISRICKRRVE